MLSPYGRPYTTVIGVAGVTGVAGALLAGLWAVAGGIAAVAAALLAFFRDPNRAIPFGRGEVVSPADGRLRAVHDVDHFPPFDGPATCLRVFLSVLDVHVVRSSCHGRVRSVEHRPGEHRNALRADAAERNEAVTLVVEHPAKNTATAAVRLIAGTIARRIVCDVQERDIIQRGQRIGMIRFGSTAELYLPRNERTEVEATVGQRVYGGWTVLARVHSQRDMEDAQAGGPVAMTTEEDGPSADVADRSS